MPGKSSQMRSPPTVSRLGPCGHPASRKLHFCAPAAPGLAGRTHTLSALTRRSLFPSIRIQIPAASRYLTFTCFRNRSSPKAELDLQNRPKPSQVQTPKQQRGHCVGHFQPCYLLQSSSLLIAQSFKAQSIPFKPSHC